MTTFILPIPLSEAFSLASLYNLLLNHDLPTSVIPSGYIPLQVVLGYFYDIRQRLVLGLLPFQVQQLSVVEVYLPFVDVLGDGKPFRRSAKTYMDQLIPTLVGGVTQFTNAQLAYFDPEHVAYKPAGGITLSFAVAQGLINTSYYTTSGAGCNTIDLYCNYTNSNASFVSGNVQAFSPSISVNTNYATAYGYSAATQWVSPLSLAACSTFA
ncbi:hypothetical protein NDA11_005759 [Ustilago hordei]|nr:hypothetical protein NDA12_007890 [Ustilago hordei]KAJ1588758.1 hypothetical protein NDA11_005759 [Ustilago hordei]